LFYLNSAAVAHTYLLLYRPRDRVDTLSLFLKQKKEGDIKEEVPEELHRRGSDFSDIVSPASKILVIQTNINLRRMSFS
jgi:hypothetical protein